MILNVSPGSASYDIILERGALKKAGAYLRTDRRAFIVTDAGVPAQYAETVAAQCREPVTVTVPQGEESKSLSVFGALLSKMLDAGMTRKDCVIAVGGGVVGDLAGFAAASYMRGIDFYNVPTTVLSQVDSSIGGKTAVNLDGIKNIVGAFYQPKRVLIDPDVLSTLPQRQISNGLAEAVKMSLTSDEKLFSLFENETPENNLDEIIAASLKIKRDVVEQDEKETGLRRILNFGHTIGHGIESEEALNGLYHGECVALGMIPMVSDALRPRLIRVLQKLGLPTTLSFDPARVAAAIAHDKKGTGTDFDVTTVFSPGEYRCEKMTLSELCARLPLIRTETKG